MTRAHASDTGKRRAISRLAENLKGITVWKLSEYGHQRRLTKYLGALLYLLVALKSGLSYTKRTIQDVVSTRYREVEGYYHRSKSWPPGRSPTRYPFHIFI